MNVAAILPTARDSAGLTDATAARPAAQPLRGAALRNAPADVQRAEVAAQFEAILVRQLLAPTMTSMLGKDGGAASSIYGDMLTDTLSQQLTRGGGLGLGRLLQQQLAPRADHAALSNPTSL